MAVRYYSPTELGMLNVNINALGQTISAIQIPAENFRDFVMAMTYSAIGAARVQVRIGVYGFDTAPPALLGTRVPCGPSSVDWTAIAHSTGTEIWSFGSRGASWAGADASPNGGPAPNPWPCKAFDIAANVSIVAGGAALLNIHLYAWV